MTQGNDGLWVAMSKKKKLTHRIPKNPILTSSASPETRRVGATHHSKTATHLEIRSRPASHSELAVHAVFCCAALDNTITAPFILHSTACIQKHGGKMTPHCLSMILQVSPSKLDGF
jgi:hypothetical protein